MKDVNNPNGPLLLVGKIAEYHVGGQVITQYGYEGPDGKQRWTLRNPYVDGATGERDADNNLVLTPPPIISDPNATAQALQDKYGQQYNFNLVEAMSERGAQGGTTKVVGYERNAEGKEIGRITVTFDGTGWSVKTHGTAVDPENGKTVWGKEQDLVIPKTTATGNEQIIAPTRLTGEPIPGDYATPMQAGVAAATQTMSGAQIAILAQDPSFQHAFITQQMNSLGTSDPMDSRIVSAWDNVTKAANAGWQMHDEQVRKLGPEAKARYDLAYPGGRPDATKTTVGVTFGGKDLKLPGLPAYMGLPTQQGALGREGGALEDIYTGSGTFGSTVLQQGQLPGQLPGPTSMGGFSPVAPPTPTTTPAPTPAPTPKVTVPPPTELATAGGVYSGTGAMYQPKPKVDERNR
jgi:hypothetical protein